MTIHNINSWLKPKYYFNIKVILKSILRQAIMWRIKKIIVIGSNLYKYLLKKEIKNKKIYYVPFNFQSFSHHEIKQKDKLKIVIPGTISKARNYHDLLKDFYDKQILERIRLVLLGKPIGSYGNEIISQCKDYNEKGADIGFYNNFIPKEVFDKEINSSDILLALFDLKVKTVDHQTEIYGLTKETGISFLLFSFAIPGFLPEEFNAMDEIKKQIIGFKNVNDLSEKVMKIINNEINLSNYREIAIKSNKEFSVHNLRSQFVHNPINKLIEELKR